MLRMSEKRGRPRSERATRAILEAALRLLQRDGYGTITIDAIAAEAGVGKQTIYRWWPSRAHLMLALIRDLAASQIADPDTGSLREDLERFLAATFAVQDKVPAIGPLLAGLMAEAQLSPNFHAVLRQELIEPRRAALRVLFERARQRRELRPRLDVETALDVAFGVLWYRVLVRHAPLDRHAARELARTLAASST
jgi:AcrR family transcriptional regulator